MLNKAFKLVFSLFLLALCFIFFLDSKIVEAFSVGDGTEGNPYIIETPEDLDSIRNNLDANYKLGADITLSGEFAPIGDYDNPFTGSLDGGGHTISNLTINQSGIANVGLFVAIDGDAAIKNLVLENVNVNGKEDVGALVGIVFNFKEISNIKVSGTVTGTYAGGLVGFLDNNGDGKINSIESSVDVTSESGGTAYIGGVIGYLSTSGSIQFTNIKGTGTMTGKGNVGGLVGYFKTDHFIAENLSFSGTIDGPDAYSEFGGIFGSIEGSGQLRNITFNGSINASSAEYIGGISGILSSDNNILLENVNISGGTISGLSDVGGAIGNFEVDGIYSIKNIAVSADVYATGQNVGGIFGYLYGDGTLDSLVSIGVVQSIDVEYDEYDKYIGGIAGWFKSNNSEAILKDSYATGNITGRSDVGGLVGQMYDVKVINSYSSSQINGETNVGGLVGSSYRGGIENSFALNSSVGSGSTVSAGRIVGFIDSASLLNNKANDSMIIAGSLSDGAGIHGEDVSLEDAKLKSTYTGWDFDTKWAIDADAYPRLQFEGIFDGTKPVITLNGDSIIYIELGGSYNDEGATAKDKDGNDISHKININNSVNTEVAGTYFVTYTATDENGNTAIPVVRTVVVSPVDNIVIDPIFSILNKSGTEMEIFFKGELDSTYVPNKSGISINNNYSLVDAITIDGSSSMYTKVIVSLKEPIFSATPSIQINAGTLKNKDGKWNSSISLQVTKNLTDNEKKSLDSNNEYLDISDVLKIAVDPSVGEGPIKDGEFNEFDILYYLTQIDSSYNWYILP